MSAYPPTPPTLVDCPQCGAPAEVLERFSLWSTSGPLEHMRTRCVRLHRFTLLAEHLGR